MLRQNVQSDVDNQADKCLGVTEDGRSIKLQTTLESSQIKMESPLCIEDNQSANQETILDSGQIKTETPDTVDDYHVKLENYLDCPPNKTEGYYDTENHCTCSGNVPTNLDSIKTESFNDIEHSCTCSANLQSCLVTSQVKTENSAAVYDFPVNLQTGLEFPQVKDESSEDNSRGTLGSTKHSLSDELADNLEIGQSFRHDHTYALSDQVDSERGNNCQDTTQTTQDAGSNINRIKYVSSRDTTDQKAVHIEILPEVKEMTQRHIRRLKCGICQKYCPKIIHTGKNSYKCVSNDVCDGCFGQVATLSEHKRTDTREKHHKCDVCDKIFISRHNMFVHRKLHTRETPHKCDVCGKNFSCRAALWGHKRIHTGEKPYKCDVCGKCFTEYGNLSRHKIIHTGEKPYKCDVCGKCFSGASDLSVHKRIHTKEQP